MEIQRFQVAGEFEFGFGFVEDVNFLFSDDQKHIQDLFLAQNELNWVFHYN